MEDKEEEEKRERNKRGKGKYIKGRREGMKERKIMEKKG